MSIARDRVANAIFVILSILLMGSGPALAQTGADSDEQRVNVRTIVTDPSQLFSVDEIQSVTRRYEDTLLSIAELQSIVDAINDLYDAKGHPLSQAVLPPQQIEDGRLHIRLVEVRVGRVSIEGNQHTNDAYFTHRISLGPGDFFDFLTLEESIIRFNIVNDVKVRASLRPGEEFATTDYVLTAVEPKNSEWRLTADTGGRTETGIVQGQVTWVGRSLRGVRDRLALSLLHSPGAQSWSGAYSFPVGVKGARLELSYADSRTRVIAGPVKDLNVTGEATDWSLRLMSPISVSTSRRVDIDATIRAKGSSTSFSDVKLLSERVDALTLAVATEVRGEGTFLSIRRALTAGWLDQGFPFYKLRFDRNLQRALERGSIAFRANLQLEGGAPLPAGEKMTMAGDQEGPVLEGSNGGYSVGAEWHVPVTSTFAPYLFADVGGLFAGVFDPRPFSASQPTTSAGIGINATFGTHVGATLTARFPLSSKSGDSHPGPAKIVARLEVTW